MSKFLIISEGGDGIGLAMRLHAEGNEVRIWIRETDADKRGTGLVEHAKDNSFGECVIADCTGAGPLLDHMRDGGSRVFGGSALADRLESDREFATQVMEQAGIQVPKSKSFTDWDTAKEFIEMAEERLVFKPEGSLSGVVPSYCPSDNGELLESIEYFKTKLGADKPEFTLQEFIEGTCVSTEAWFDGAKFIRPFNHTIERKHLMVGDIGPSGGCVGNVVWPVGDECPIVQATVLRLEEFLAEHEYRGAIDVNCVVNEEGCYALEFTPRFGYDAFPTFLYSLFTGDFGSFIWSCCDGSHAEFMDIADRFGAGVRLTQPPWPTDKYDAEAGVPIRGLKETDLVDFFYPYEVSKHDGKLSTSGPWGIVGVCNAYGANVGQAFARAYERVERIKFPDMQYRTDLGETCFKDHRELELATGQRRSRGWEGVDLDGTLASYANYSSHPGPPVERMVNRVKRWIADGKEVRVVTARVADREIKNQQLVRVHDWINEHIGTPLHVQAHKDHEMKRLHDDRVVRIEQDTGRILE